MWSPQPGPIEKAVLDGLSDMMGAQVRDPLQVGDGPGQPHSPEADCLQPTPPPSRAEATLSTRSCARAESAKRVMACPRIRADASSRAHQRRISRDLMWLFAPNSGVRRKRWCCRSRAAVTRIRTASLGSAEPTALKSSIGTAGTSMWRSMRSNKGPETRERYRATAAGSHVHRSPSAPYRPHGHGFIAAASMKRAGYRNLERARERLTTPSSIGCRSASRTDRRYSGSSSRNSTP